MRSFSSTLPQARVGISGGEFLRWTPDLLEVAAPPPPQEDPQELIETAVREALDEASARASEREAALIAEAAEERERAVREAFERGYETGREEGERGEAARLRTAVEAAEEALDEVRAGEIRWTGTIEENICALAVIIARQILGRELALDPQAVADLVRSALNEFPIDQPIRIRINPSDLSALSSVGAIDHDPLKQIAIDRDARWLPDVSIAPGGCVVEGRERIIDGRIDTALERIYRRLTYTHA